MIISGKGKTNINTHDDKLTQEEINNILNLK